MTFRVGQKVVCINAKPCPVWGALTLRQGAIYTVAHYDASYPSLLLVEDISPHPTGEYMAKRFRPIVERKTDIGFAHEILRKATKQAPAASPLVTSKER